MPLKRGRSPAVIRENIRRLVREGVPRTQAVARAIHKARQRPQARKG